MKLRKFFDNIKKYLPQNRNLYYLLPIAIYLLEFIIWNSDLVKNFGTNIPSSGSTYQNIYAYMMYLVNFYQGKFLSLEGSQFSWYEGVLSANEISQMPALIFGFFYLISNNYALSLNLMIVIYLIGLQFAIFLLLNRWTKNKIISTLLPLALPLSGGWVISNSHHIHALVLIGVFFLIYALENYLFDQRRSWNWVALIVISTLFWVFSSAHSLAIGALILIFWGLYNSPKIYKVFIKKPTLLIKLGSILFVTISGFLIFLYNFIQASKVYSDGLNTPYRAAATNFNMDFFSYTVPLINLGLKFIKDDFRFEFDIFKYPDAFSNSAFLIGILAFIPLLIFNIIRYKKLPAWLYWFGVFLFFYVIALGPFFKVKNWESDQIKLPHYYLFKIFYPIQVIRATWRFNFAGFIALLFSVGILAGNLLNFVNQSKFKILKTKVVLKSGVYGLLLLAIFFSVTQNSPKSVQAYQENKFLVEYLDKSLTKKQVVDYFYYSAPQQIINTGEEQYRAMSLIVGKYNLDKGYQAINWVAGGGLGTPVSAEDIFILMAKEKYQEVAIQILYKKQVDLVQIDKDKNERLLNLFEKYYTKVDENHQSTLWKIKEEAIETNTVDFLKIDLASSNKLEINQELPVYINLSNNTSQTYVNPDKVFNLDYYLELNKDGVTRFSENIKITKDPFYLANQGKTILKKIKPSNLPEGKYNLILKDSSKNNLYQKEVELLNKSNFQKEVDAYKNESLLIQSTSSDLQYNRKDFIVRNLKTEFRVQNGVIQAQQKNTQSDLPYIFNLEFKGRQGEVYPVISQINYYIEGTYFPGDQVQIWATQYLPEYDEKNNLEYSLKVIPVVNIGRKQKIIDYLKILRSI